MEVIGFGGEDNVEWCLIVLRVIDKFDKFGIEGVCFLLGEGCKDDSGDFIKGVGFNEEVIEMIVGFVFGIGNLLNDGVIELNIMVGMFDVCGYGLDCVKIDLFVVCGLEYYIGLVYEVELLFDVINEKGEVV